MIKKVTMLGAFGLGYVLGARAGRERYDAIVAKAQQWSQDPRVQRTASRAQEKAQDVVKDKLPGSSTGSAPGVGS